MFDLPYNIEGEQALIASFVHSHMKTVGAMTALERLSADDFFEPLNQKIFQIIADLFSANRLVDTASVGSYLQKESEKEYFTQVYKNNLSHQNIGYYLKMVEEAATERRMIEACRMAANTISDGKGTHADRMNEAESKFSDINRESEDYLIDSRELTDGFVDEIETRFKSTGEVVGLSTGFSDLDDMLGGLRGGQMIVVAGAAKMGKTTLALNFSQSILRSGKYGLFFSMEMSAQELFERRVAYEGGIDSNMMRVGFKNDSNSENWNKFNAGLLSVKEQALIVDDTPALHINQIKTRARIAKKKYGIDFIVVDYIGLARGDGESQNIRVQNVSQGIKALAKELDVPIIALAQLNRSGQEGRPKTTSLRDSGSIEQDADCVMFIYRDEVYNENTAHKGVAEVIVAAQRSGKTGTAYLQSDLKSYRFRNLAVGELERIERSIEEAKNQQKPKPSRFGKGAA
jgi:replicative DNA helicase